MQLTLRAWRVNSGYSIEEVAKLTDKTDRTIRNWENGATIPDKANLEILASLYHTKIDFIFLGDKSALGEWYKTHKHSYIEESFRTD